MTNQDIVAELLQSIGMPVGHGLPEDVARLQVHGNKVVGTHLLPGLLADVEEQPDGIHAVIRVKNGVKIAKPIHICFGLLPERGIQHIRLEIVMEEHATASVLAHCTFPNAVEVEHKMDAVIQIQPHAVHSYLERHVHGDKGGVLVIPKAKISVEEGAHFKTEFELIKGSAGKIFFDYEATCKEKSILEMIARISGKGEDTIQIRETGLLQGAYARAILKTSIAVRDHARADVYNALTAAGPYSRGHVDCKEIVQGAAVARATPIVEVNHPTAHVTHEAAIGSVDSKQLETLMSRGLSEEDAVELIIRGMLS